MVFLENLMITPVFVCTHTHTHTLGPFENFVDWRQCAAVMQREAMTVTPSCSGGGNVVVASSSSL
jgi:hypothetical protein